MREAQYAGEERANEDIGLKGGELLVSAVDRGTIVGNIYAY